MVVALQKLLNPYFGETLNSLALLFFFFFVKGSATLGAFIADPEVFFCFFREESEKLLLSVIKAVHATILGFCLDQTELSLWSRQSRDKEVSERTLASLGISFTGVEEAHTL